jgi:hypothetical protein
VLFGVTYVALYWRIVRFKTPKWLVFRREAFDGVMPVPAPADPDKPEPSAGIADNPRP